VILKILFIDFVRKIFSKYGIIVFRDVFNFTFLIVFRYIFGLLKIVIFVLQELLANSSQQSHLTSGADRFSENQLHEPMQQQPPDGSGPFSGE
jgi:hypothetical protein